MEKKYQYDFSFVLWLNLLGHRFFAIIAVANIVILICCYMISSYSILSKDFPTVTETFIEYCRKYPFCTCCYFHRKGKIAKEKNGKCTICGRRKTEILQHEHWKSCYKWNNVYCVFCQTEWLLSICIQSSRLIIRSAGEANWIFGNDIW